MFDMVKGQLRETRRGNIQSGSHHQRPVNSNYQHYTFLVAGPYSALPTLLLIQL